MTESPPAQLHTVLVTGPSGAGRTTALRALEDMGFEAIDNLPLSLVGRLLAEGGAGPLALGLDTRNRDFSTNAILRLVDRMAADPGIDVDLMYLDARVEILVNRFSQTRRRHPLASAETPNAGILCEVELLRAVRERAGILIDTSDLSPHDLRDEIGRLLGREEGQGLAVSVQSFSYKRGLPLGADMVFDVRFLRNPHWEPELRDRTGQDSEVAGFIAGDERYADATGRMVDLLLSLLPAFGSEGKAHLTAAFGCTGGQHRSVAVAEHVAKALANRGWRVSTRHRELERRAGNGPPTTSGGTAP